MDASIVSRNTNATSSIFIIDLLFNKHGILDIVVKKCVYHSNDRRKQNKHNHIKLKQYVQLQQYLLYKPYLSRNFCNFSNLFWHGHVEILLYITERQERTAVIKYCVRKIGRELVGLTKLPLSDMVASNKEHTSSLVCSTYAPTSLRLLIIGSRHSRKDMYITKHDITHSTINTTT